MSNHALYEVSLQAAFEKWRHRLPVRNPLHALLIESQDSHGVHPGVTLPALVRALNASPLDLVCSVQPMVGPVSPIFYLTAAASAASSGQIPTITLNITEDTVRAQTRALVRFAPTEDPHHVLERGFRQIVREVIGEIRSTVTTRTQLPRGTSLYDGLLTASHVVHRRSQRSPATWLVTGSATFERIRNTEGFAPYESLLEDLARAATGDQNGDRLFFAGVYRGRWFVVVDTMFPENEVLLGRHGASFMDTPTIYAPLYFNSQDTANSDDRVLCVRHVIKIVKPGQHVLLTIEN